MTATQPTATRPQQPSQERLLATRLVALKVLAAEIAAADQAAREEMLTLALPGDNFTAAVSGPDGQVPVGKVVTTKGRAGGVTAEVSDERALLAWCREHRPTAVTEVVRSSDQRALLEEAKMYGGVLGDEGVITAISGITVVETPPGKPGLSVRPAEGAAETFREAFAQDWLRLTDLVALPEATS